MLTEQKLKIFRALDKLDRLGAKAVLELLTVGRRDQSGDFTEGAGLSLEAAWFMMRGIGIDCYVICYRPEQGFAWVYVDA